MHKMLQKVPSSEKCCTARPGKALRQEIFRVAVKDLQLCLQSGYSFIPSYLLSSPPSLTKVKEGHSLIATTVY